MYEAFTQLFGKSTPFVIEKSEGNSCFITSCNKNTEFTPELIAHELGHKFANDRGNQPYSDLEGAQEFDDFGDFVFGSVNGAYNRTLNGYKSDGIPNMYHGPKNWTDWNSNANNVARNEDWADMFMNWIFNNFAPGSAGSKRYNWMNNWMTINLAQ